MAIKLSLPFMCLFFSYTTETKLWLIRRHAGIDMGDVSGCIEWSLSYPVSETLTAVSSLNGVSTCIYFATIQG